MNNVSQITIMDRIRNAIRAFKAKPIQFVSLGVDVKRCNECEYKGGAEQREHLMVIMGMRAAYMDCAGMIDILQGFAAEGNLVWFVRKIVEQYIQEPTDVKGVNFDEYIETALFKQYGIKSPHELYETYKREWCESRGYDPEAMDESIGIDGECYACFDEWYANGYAELKED